MPNITTLIERNCSGCKAKDDCPSRFIVGNNVFCSEADAIRNGYLKCECCGKYSRRHSFIKGVGYVCEKCIGSDMFTTCDICGERTLKEHAETKELQTVGRKETQTITRTICKDCLGMAEKNFKRGRLIRCKDCGKLLWDASPNGDYKCYYCSDCSKNFVICSCCGRPANPSFSDPLNSSIKYCSDCYEIKSRQLSERYIHGWHYSKSRGAYKFILGDNEDRLNTRTYGIELEVDSPSSSNTPHNMLFDNDNSSWWRRGFLAKYIDGIKTADGRNAFFTETDSSVYYGLEIISQPFSRKGYEILKPHLKDILDICKAKGFRSGSGTGCGLHIHISKAGWKSLSLAKLIVLSSRMVKCIKKISRRLDDGAILQWNEDYWTDGEIREHSGYANYFNLEQSFSYSPNWTGDSLDKLVSIVTNDKRLENNEDFRHSIINISNRNTIEFRFFKGTLNMQYIDAALDFVDYFAGLALTKTADEVFTMTEAEFMEGARNYSELLKNYIDFVTAPVFPEICESVNKYNTWRIKESELDVNAKEVIYGKDDELVLSCNKEELKNNNR